MTGITNPTEEYFKDGLWGWDGTQWRKLGLLFGYYDRLADQVVNYNATAGTNWLEGDPVPEGEVHVIQVAAAANTVSNVAHIYLRANAGDAGCPLADEYNVAAGHWIFVVTGIVMKAGDFLSCAFYGCADGDDLYLRWWGYKMRVS